VITRRIIAALLAGSALVGVPSAGFAADMPVKAPPTAVVQHYGGYYIWVDGSYQAIRLPTYDLGARRTNLGVASTDTGVAVQSYDPRATGAGVAAAVGFFLPPGALPGSNARIELGGSFVDARQSQASAAPDLPRLALFPIGGGTNFTSCGVGICTVSSSLSTRYQAWQVNAKAASDIRTGAVTWTAAITAFGGEARNNQDFLQTIASGGGSGTYTAGTTLRWTDWGAKAGLDARVELSPAIALGMGGTVGVAARDASLDGNDRCVQTTAPTLPCTGIGPQVTTVRANATTTPFLANAEARVFVTPWRNVALKGFVGLNYDSRVPGILKPTWVGDAGLPTVGTPAGIRFEHLTSWYAGGGIVVNFGGPVVARN
jgi:hypothetical protein